MSNSHEIDDSQRPLGALTEEQRREIAAKRITECVDAVRGIPNPAAIKDVVEAARPFATGRIVMPSQDPESDPAVVVTLSELEALRAALARLDDGEEE